MRAPFIGLCLAATAATAMTAATAAPPTYPDVPRDTPLTFPRDHGSHPDFRTEWWYVTGLLDTPDGATLGFQVTFFRSRPPIDEADPSRFAPRQILFAHAALGEAKTGRLLSDERVARAGFGIAESREGDAAVVLDGWRFERVPSPGEGATDRPTADALHFRTHLEGERFAVDLDLRAVAGIMAEGADPMHPGWSQKGPSPRDASRYYSVPQLRVTGTIARGDPQYRKPVAITGTAWLDREWSSAYLDPQAAGWDWAGLNLDDGGAVMAFRMRDRAGARLWAGGAWRHADGTLERFGPDDVDFRTDRTWRSAATGTTYPVAQTVRIGGVALMLLPLMDDQELDSRGSTGTIYWEGAVRVERADRRGQPIGKGFLELTGYAAPLRF